MILSSWLLAVWIRDEAQLGEIYAEFLRVLKTRGEVRMYPQPDWRPESFTDPKLIDVARRIAVAQRFVISPRWLTLPPAYILTFRKKSPLNIRRSSPLHG